MRGGTFIAAIERIYLSSGGGNDELEISDTTNDVAIEFEPQIARK